MLTEFLDFIRQEELFLPNERILLAVSGGMDSVTMAELFYRAGFSFGIAHCNFSLRGNESDQEAEFVQGLAAKYGVSFYVKQRGRLSPFIRRIT